LNHDDDPCPYPITNPCTQSPLLDCVFFPFSTLLLFIPPVLLSALLPCLKRFKKFHEDS
jgi:hypothetical protein